MPGSLIWQHTVNPSLRFAVSLVLLHSMAAAVLYATAITWPARLVMLALIILSLVYYLARDALLLLRDSWHEIALDQNDVSVVTRDGTSFSGQIADATFVSPYFVVLCVKPEQKRFQVSRVIFPDAMSTGAFRELCVHLKYA